WHLAPFGTAGVVLANGSMSSNQSGEGDIRRAMVEADAVDCMVALPGQLFYSTQIPACLWFLARDRSGGSRARPGSGQAQGLPLRDRRGEVLFIDARNLGTLVDRTRRELSDADIQKIADTYHAWRGAVGAGLVPARDKGDHSTTVGAGLVPARDKGDHSTTVGAGLVPARDKGDHKGRPYTDIPGFCKSATLDEIRKHGHVLTPGRYVGAEAAKEDGEPFADRIQRLSTQWREQQQEAARLDAAIADNLKALGF
ncbi:N-6 DNA methylase, partial [Algiphilus sp. W345]